MLTDIVSPPFLLELCKLHCLRSCFDIKEWKIFDIGDISLVLRGLSIIVKRSTKWATILVIRNDCCP